MKIFISYRRFEDSKTLVVGLMYERLVSEFGADNVFRDTYDISGGEKWRRILEHALNECDIMLVMIGADWANLTLPDGRKRLFDEEDITRWEVETGLRRSQAGEVTVIPVLMLDAPIPSAADLPASLRPLLERNVVRLRNLPAFYEDIATLVHDIRKAQGFAVKDIDVARFEPKTVFVAAGNTWMGSPPGEGIPVYEMPRHEVHLPAFRFGIAPVTNEQFKEYIVQAKREAAHQLGWDGLKVPKGFDNHPVTGVTWYEAMAYCEWLSRVTGRSYSLPTEVQWEKACRAGERCTFPWGDEFEEGRCNHQGVQIASVNQYPPQNKFGCRDLVGNVLQWTRTVWEQEESQGSTPYPWQEDERDDPDANSETPRVLRGSSIRDEIALHRCSARRGDFPDNRGFGVERYGFRVVMSV